MTVSPASPLPIASPDLPPDMAVILAACRSPMAIAGDDGRRVGANAAFCAAADWLSASETAAETAAETAVEWPAATVFTPLATAGLRLATVPPPLESVDDLPRRLLNALPVMASVKDLDGRYLFMNAYQAAHFGVAAEQALGRRLGDLAGERYDDHLGDLEREVLRTGCPAGFFDVDGAGVDGELRHWLAFKGPLRGPEGETAGVTFLAVDVSERKAAESALRHAYMHAEEAVRTRGRYLATLGHELKTPLHSIVGFSEFLAQETLGPLGDATYRDYAQDIVAAGRHLLELVTDILDMARLEAGRLPLDEEPLDLVRTAADVVRMLALPARRKGVAVTVETAPTMPQIVADVRRVRQMLVNLLGNAVKFTPEGGHVAMRIRQAANGDAVLEVQDDGPGIRPEDVATVLTPFGRVSAPGAPPQDGAGLGLPLVKALAEAHGGRFELISAPGGGVVARVILPRFRLRTD